MVNSSSQSVTSELKGHGLYGLLTVRLPHTCVHMCVCIHVLVCTHLCGNVFYTLLLHPTCLAQHLAGVTRDPNHGKKGEHVGKLLGLGKKSGNEGLGEKQDNLQPQEGGEGPRH